MAAPQKTIAARLWSFIRRKTSQQYKFDQQFAGGVWEGLAAPGESGRYSIIVGYTGMFCPGARILDLGCGAGVLQERFANTNYASYTGIDFSAVAIEKARQQEDARTRFAVGDLNKLNIEGEFDAIIYNESIYYLSDPIAAIKALFKTLAPGGVFIFSIVDKHGKEQTSLWNPINELLDLQDKTKVINGQGHAWTVHVYKLKQG